MHWTAYFITIRPIGDNNMDLTKEVDLRFLAGIDASIELKFLPFSEAIGYKARYKIDISTEHDNVLMLNDILVKTNRGFDYIDALMGQVLAFAEKHNFVIFSPVLLGGCMYIFYRSYGFSRTRLDDDGNYMMIRY